MDVSHTVWQERYKAWRIYTLKCRVVDKPGMLGKFLDLVGQFGAHVGDIKLTGVDSRYKHRDITIFCSDNGQLEQIRQAASVCDYAQITGFSDDVMEIHKRGVIDIVSRVPIKTLTDLRMVYTPGVASVCEEIERNRPSAWEFTGICDRVAVVTNGTAVLGLGDIGVLPSLPVMEGKAAIFAEFADISACPILVDSRDADTVVETVCRISTSFGAIQLEDIAAPECFEVEQKLQDKLDIPVFHDDQHGTATVVLAALINALKKTGRKASNSRVLMLGAGAAGMAITKMLRDFGLGDILVYDSVGPIYRGRTEKMNPFKEEIAGFTNADNFTGSLADGFRDRDIFIGVSRPKMVGREMIANMASEAIVFPLSNPVGEIDIDEAKSAGAVVTADGRGINNAYAYPGIFRGALDARAKKITSGMKMAAARRLAELAPAGQLLPDILDRGVHKSVAEAVYHAWYEG